MTSTEKLEDGKTTVQSLGGYHLITHGTWQVTVMLDATVSLPRIVRPEDIDDFCAAMQAAKEVALRVKAENTESETSELQKEQERIASARDASSRRQKNAAQAKRVQSARSGGSRGARKSELESVPSEES